MQLNKENVVKVLSKNFGFTKIEDPELGDMIEMSDFDAYVYSAITGHEYLDNDRQPFTPNGLMQVFNQANAYNLVTGMFDRDGNLFHTPLSQVKTRPFLLGRKKYILPVEYDTNVNLQEKLLKIQKYLVKVKKERSDFIICRIKKSTGGYSMEPFMEYVATKYFNRSGYLTETQIPFYYSGGTPDFAAYCLPEINKLIEKYLKFNGSSFIALASIRTFGLYKEKSRYSTADEAIVGEVKTGSLKALQQVKKYLGKGVFNKAYEIIPNKKSPEIIAGLFTFDDDGEIKIFEARTPATIIPEKQAQYLLWLQDYIKYFLLANLTNEELDTFYSQRTGKRTRTISELIAFVNSIQIEEILIKIVEYINGK